MYKKAGFTMIELLIVISIIAILAAAVIPNFIGFDMEARVSATKSNVDTMRTRITLYRAKEGKYPEALEDMTVDAYVDAGVKKKYLKKIPKELISKKEGSRRVIDQPSTEPISGKGGWVYFTDTAEVVVNLTKPLDRKWGEYEGDIPRDW